VQCVSTPADSSISYVILHTVITISNLKPQRVDHVSKRNIFPFQTSAIFVGLLERDENTAIGKTKSFMTNQSLLPFRQRGNMNMRF